MNEKNNPYRAVSSRPQKTSGSQPDKMQVLNLIGCMVAAIGGWITWQASPSLIGQVEPWDDPSSFYSIAIVLAAAAGGIFSGWKIWFPILGTYLGQVAYCTLFYHPGGPVIFPLAIAVALFGVLPSIVGSISGASLRSMIYAIVK